MSFDASDIAGLVAAGMTPADIRIVTASGLTSLTEYLRLTDDERSMLGIKTVAAAPFHHDTIWVAAPGDLGYPDRLAATQGAPPVLFGVGDKHAVTPGVAVIGTRDMTAIGAHVARSAVEGARRAGVSVISGLAAGCDTAAHRAALDTETTTVAVVAGGVDVTYPADNKALAAEILEHHGAIVSEQPPGTPVTVRHLMARNRIITGISHVVVPCEAGRNSRGTIAAVGTALAQDRLIVVGRVKPAWRHYDGAWLAERLATGNQIDTQALGWSAVTAGKINKLPGAIANGIGDDRETIAELVEFAVMWSNAVGLALEQTSSAVAY
jgi:DNA protecting protein DprA